MNNKVRGGLSIFLMSIFFYMMVTTRYTHALGDYVIEFIGLKSWTGNYSGTHLTVIYFGILFIIGLFLVEKFAVGGLNISRRRVFFIFVVLMTVFSLTTGIVAKNIKKNSSGLLAIGYNSDTSSMNYRCEENKYVEFIAEFELTNYSDVKKIFNISIDSPYFRNDGIKEISFYTFEGELAIFELESNETKSFSLSLNDFKVSGGRKLQNGSGSGSIAEILLTDNNGNRVRLEKNNFWGIAINK